MRVPSGAARLPRTCASVPPRNGGLAATANRRGINRYAVSVLRAIAWLSSIRRTLPQTRFTVYSSHWLSPAPLCVNPDELVNAAKDAVTNVPSYGLKPPSLSDNHEILASYFLHLSTLQMLCFCVHFLCKYGHHDRVTATTRCSSRLRQKPMACHTFSIRMK